MKRFLIVAIVAASMLSVVPKSEAFFPLLGRRIAVNRNIRLQNALLAQQVRFNRAVVSHRFVSPFAFNRVVVPQRVIVSRPLVSGFYGSSFSQPVIIRQRIGGCGSLLIR